jgi:hypothetical protein
MHFIKFLIYFYIKLFLVGVYHVSTVIQNSEVNNVSKVIIIHNANTKSSVGQHHERGPKKNWKVGSGVAEK